MYPRLLEAVYMQLSLVRIAEGEEGKCLEVRGHFEDFFHLLHVLLVGSDAEPDAAEAEIRRFEPDVLLRRRHVDVREPRHGQAFRTVGER